MAAACVIFTVAVVVSVVILALGIVKFIVIVVGGGIQCTRAEITLCEHQLKYGGNNCVCCVLCVVCNVSCSVACVLFVVCSMRCCVATSDSEKVKNRHKNTLFALQCCSTLGEMCLDIREATVEMLRSSLLTMLKCVAYLNNISNSQPAT